MTTSEPIPRMNDQDRYPDTFNLPRQNANFYITSSVGEHQIPEVVERAQQIHGVSYVNYDYFDESGKEQDGRLVPDLDGTRSDPSGRRIANYLVASEFGQPIENGQATVRLLDIGANGTLEDIPTYKYFVDTFDEDTKAKLNLIVSEYGKQGIREVAALGTIEAGKHHGSYELMRALVQNSIIKDAEGHSEMYIASLTDNSFRPVLSFIHPASADILAKPVQIFSDDPRSKMIYVTPVLMDLTAVLKNTAKSAEDARSSAEAAKYKDHFWFVADGLPMELVEKYSDGHLGAVKYP